MTQKTAKNADNPREKAVYAALELSAELGWGNVSLQDISERSGIHLHELSFYFEDKSDILCSLGRMIDQKTLEHASSADPDASVRDALFDVFMDRFDVLNDYREGIVGILNSFKLDPKQAVISLPHLCRSMNWMLEAAHVNTGGIRGAVKVAGMTALYLRVLKVWLSDESPDLSATMAALDKDLGRAEQFANSFSL